MSAELIAERFEGEADVLRSVLVDLSLNHVPENEEDLKVALEQFLKLQSEKYEQHFQHKTYKDEKSICGDPEEDNDYEKMQNENMDNDKENKTSDTQEN